MSAHTVYLYKVLPKENYHLLIPAPNKTDVCLVSIDPQSGALHHSGQLGRDLFPNKETAEDYLQTLGVPQIEGSGVAVLGYVVIGYTGLLLLVEKARISAVLPGPVTIKTISNSKWFRIPFQADLTPLQQIEILSSFEIIENRIGKIVEFPLQGAHWYSEDADVSRPFPSNYPRTQPSWQFVWNAWLSQSFQSIDLGACCPAVMEGTAETRDLNDVIGDSFKLVLLSRRSRLNAGTRYIARGLNDDSEPGNEIECEQIVWCESKDSKNKVLWNRYSWRRGEAEIHIKRHRTFEGCKKYIRRIQKRFYPNQDINCQLKSKCAASSSTSTPYYCNTRFPIVFVSLLRKGLPDRSRSETDLAAAFDQALSLMRRVYNLNTAYYSLDWHEMDKQLGTAGLIEALWATMKGMLKDHGVASGHYSRSGESTEDHPRSDWCGKGTVHWYTQQEGLARYNCADSLDRTNIASFFISVQVFVEQCRLLELAVLTDGSTETMIGTRGKPTIKERLFGNWPIGFNPSKLSKDLAWMMTGGLKGPEESKLELPLGWESKVDPGTGRVYYIDHNTKTTSWTLPAEVVTPEQDIMPSRSSSSSISKPFGTRCKEEILSTEAWQMLDLSVDEIRRKVLPEALASIAEVFLLNGDRNAFFYTGSQAMHSDKITIFEPETSPLKKNGIGGAGNSIIAITRRYNNVMRDSDRQAQIELFLGLNLEKHFAISSQHPVQNLDALNIIYLPNKTELDFPDTDDEDDVMEQTYPALKRDSNVVIRDRQLQPVETRRSQSSPMLDRVNYSSTSDSSEEDETNEDLKMGSSSVDGELKSSGEIMTPRSELVPGLRSLPTTHNPLS
eukprot:g3300.t1